MSESTLGNDGRSRWAAGWRLPPDVPASTFATTPMQNRPTIVVVEDDGPGRDVLVRSLKRRYGNDYRRAGRVRDPELPSAR